MKLSYTWALWAAGAALILTNGQESRQALPDLSDQGIEAVLADHRILAVLLGVLLLVIAVSSVYRSPR